MLAVEIDAYTCLVPYVENDADIFLKKWYPGGTEGITTWLVDTDRFSSSWIAAVEQTIDKVKEKVTATDLANKNM